MNKKVLVTNHFEVSSDFYSNIKPVAHGILRTIGRKITSEKQPVFFFSNVPCALFYDDFYRKELCDDYSSAFFTEGLRCYYDGLYEKAKAISMKGLAFNPYNADILYNLGAIYHASGEPDEAMKFYKAAIIALGKKHKDKRTIPLINGQAAKCYNNIGTIYEKKGVSEEALNFYKKAVELDRNFAQGYYNIGVVYWKKKVWIKVISSFEKCLEIDPNNQQARHYLKIAKERIAGGRNAD